MHMPVKGPYSRRSRAVMPNSVVRPARGVKAGAAEMPLPAAVMACADSAAIGAAVWRAAGKRATLNSPARRSWATAPGVPAGRTAHQARKRRSSPV